MDNIIIKILKRIKRKVFYILARIQYLISGIRSNFIKNLADAIIRIFVSIKRGRSDEVRSVLHLGSLSHKPFMLSRLMRQKGLKSEYLAIEAESGWLQVGERGYDYNYSLNNPFKQKYSSLVTAYYLCLILGKYDVIHYHNAAMLTSTEREIEDLKKMGKIIVFHYRGCDLRQGSVNRRMNPELNCCQECDYPPGSCENEVQLKRIELARKYGDLLFVTTPDLKDFLPEAEHIPFIAPSGIDFDKIEAAPKNNAVFRIVTSSNHDGVDGTKYVRDAVSRLRQENPAIELVEVHKTPYEKALAIYKSADLFVGKLLMGYYNNANIECMMMGIPVMSFIREQYRNAVPDCPVIVTRPETVYDNLREHISNPEELKNIGAKGRDFVRKYHDPDTIVDLIIKKYNEALKKRQAQSNDNEDTYY